jgi:hypothetical protein
MGKGAIELKKVASSLFVSDFTRLGRSSGEGSSGMLREGRVTHAEARPHVFGYQGDGMTIGDWIHAREISHGLY